MRIILDEGQYIRLIEGRAGRKFIGSGAHHSVFQSIFTKGFLSRLGLVDNKLLFKTGDDIEMIKAQAETFKLDSRIFPIVYKVGTLLDDEGIRVGYMVVEKLDTDGFKEKYKRLEKYFREDDMQLYFHHFSGMRLPGYWRFMREADEDLRKFFLSFAGVVNKLKNMDMRKELKYVGGRGLDLHDDNFGLTADGRVKCLDY